MPKSALFFVPLLTALLVFPGQNGRAEAQETLFHELGAFYLNSASDNVELPDPVGFGLFARWEMAPGWLFRLSYHRSQDETRKDGVVCDRYSPRINCRVEPTETEVILSGLRGAVSRVSRLGGWGEIGLGAGLSFNRVNPEARDLTGWRADMLVPNTGQIGYLASLSTTLAPAGSIPILLVAGYTGHWINFNGCSGEEPPQYDPFCGWESLREMELGLSYAF